ncbi:MAG TPA: VOC family protein [Solirubrobacterales bacterium]|jgi:catechol 2,3-dioxygenase-like lactoylglutathione lyase family enzyme|nr:VOC family protein [Solirubrobacterales bacterium]HMU26923.1 VOC family protein [Solirubrobacterales bacterium]HMX71728.1 VOC family protein [Solirubrobacterales bacterium]HMY26454.1 VOC family protein [Solirubrobacterales bacterium]HNA23935.1 VOC family protein [Solirubrobacterales bacterium]
MSLSECRIAAVAAVSDLDRSRAFFEGTLGLSAVDSGAGGDEVVYSCGEGTGLMVYPSPENAGKGTATLGCWAVDDLESEMKILKDRGIEFERYEGFDQDENGILDMGDGRVAWFTDPDGNIFAVAEG